VAQHGAPVFPLSQQLAFRGARGGIDDFNPPANKSGAHTERRIEMNRKNRRTPTSSLLPADRQTQDRVLVIEPFHMEFVDIVKSQRCQRMVFSHKGTSFVCELPEMHPRLKNRKDITASAPGLRRLCKRSA
jgi:hypothetical protein